MMGKVLWDKAKTETLIREYRRHPELWNCADAGFKNRGCKAEILRKFAEDFCTDENEITRKIHNLRNQMSAELRKVLIRNSIANRPKEYRSKWPYFDSMLFLREVLTKRSGSFGKSKHKSQTSMEASEVIAEYSSGAMDQELSSRSSEETDEAVQNLERTGSKDLAPEKRTKDEWDEFGEFVANEFRALKADEHKRKLKRMIHEAILDVAEQDCVYGYNVLIDY